MENKVLSNLFGILGTIIWSIQLIPQIHLNFKMKSTKGVSTLCFSSWYACGVVLATYLVFMNSAPALIIQISSFSIFCLVIIFQYLFYEKYYPIKKLLFVIGLVTGLSFIISIGIYMFMKSFKSNEFALEIACTVISSSLMAIGFLPQILVIYQSKSTVGLSKIFVFMDFCGGVFSILSLSFHNPFDWMAFSTYVIVPIFQSILMAMIYYYDPKRFAGKSSFQQINDIEQQAPNDQELLDGHAILSNDHESSHESDSSALLVKETQVINSSTLLTSPTPNVQHTGTPLPTQATTLEFDNILPESVLRSTDALAKQTEILNQSTSILLSIPQPNSNLGVHGYPVS
ncbi:hypothetical protein CYY_000540 [Polysphondylium violaceum]|uniref:Uncharacterized protein n=1 Tax=Polysphondylium violaceum TaxID=133409 RepID=A0A8J4Q1L9_9MYCE|nr:hypothetical protein CYY_000540 [Polysphondylium violaceum]